MRESQFKISAWRAVSTSGDKTYPSALALSSSLSVVLQEEEWESGLQFLQATDSRQLEKKPGRRKKMWIGLGLVLASAGVALLTGLLVWHFHRELPSNKPI